MKQPKPRLMFIESKNPGSNGEARIARVDFSKSGKSIYYDGKMFTPLENGYRANFEDATNGDLYWIAPCDKNGKDRIYKSDLPIHIDEDSREEYWTVIRGQPENIDKENC